MDRAPHRASIAMLVYAALIGSTVLAWNYAEGGMIQKWNHEYLNDEGAVRGSGKWRTSEGKTFRDFAAYLGTWVYPCAALAALLFISSSIRASNAKQRVHSVLFAGISLAILAAFIRLGVWRSITAS